MLFSFSPPAIVDAGRRDARARIVVVTQHRFWRFAKVHKGEWDLFNPPEAATGQIIFP